MKGNEGFTLIELIVVMAIVAILVLLAAPRFLGYTKEADVTAMIQDTKVLSDAVELYHIDSNKWPIPKGSQPHVLGIGGVDEVYPLDETKLKNSIKNIKGDFNDYGVAIDGEHKGRVFHIEGINNRFDVPQYGSKLENLDEKYREYLATDDDFSGETNGNFKYIGESKIVLIPHTIKGIPITSYNKMFEGTDVVKVISTNANVVNMSFMFAEGTGKQLDVSELYSANVETMYSMFHRHKGDKINLKGFSTASLKNAYRMFKSSSLKEIDVSGFDTSNVVYTSDMFMDVNLDSLDLSTFSTNNISSIAYMFYLTSIEDLKLGDFNAPKVDDYRYMFYGFKTNKLDLTSFNTKNIDNMRYMFNLADIKELDLSSFDMNDNIDTTLMFDNANIEKIYVKEEYLDFFNSFKNDSNNINFIAK